MNSSRTVRGADAADIDQLAALAARFYAEEGFATPPESIRANLAMLIHSSAARVLLAESDGRAVAFAVATSTPGLEHNLVAELQDLYVLPEHRSHGVAAMLVDEVMSWARAYGCEVVDVVVDAAGDTRHALTDWYRRRGFHDQGRRLLSASLSDGRSR